MRGKFITLEGIDGAGKSTHLGLLVRYLEGRGIRIRVTREPGGTMLGEKLRELLLGRRQRLHPDTEALLMFAARREHLETVIRPALDSGRWVVCDRFTDATYAYQAGGSGVGWDRVAVLEQWVQQGLQPDLTVILDIEPSVGRQRAQRTQAPDRFESEEQVFFQRVRAAYLRRARECPSRIRVIDAHGEIADVQKRLEEIVSCLCSDV